MSPFILLRVSAVLMFLHFAGHTANMLRAPSHQPRDVQVLETMRNYRFDVMGSNRSYFDFFQGFGFDASIAMALQTILLWQVASMARTNRQGARPFIATFVVIWIASLLLYVRYFFLAPILFAALMVVVLVAAWASAGRKV